jgi:hypothetical protein
MFEEEEEKQPPFEYIKNYYKVPAEFGREIMFEGKRKGIIVEDKGNYIGVNFYDSKPDVILPLHPTSGVEYLETIGKIRKVSRSKERYRLFLQADTDMKFIDWLRNVYPVYYK